MPDIADMLGNRSIQLQPGDVMLLYTDGIAVAWRSVSEKDRRDPLTEMCGQERLARVLGELGRRESAAIKDGIIDTLADYRLSDDIMLVVIKRSLDPES